MARASKARAAGKPFPTRQAVILVAAALAFRLVYWLLASKSLFMQTPVVDGSFFDIWARTLAAGRVFQAQAFFKPPLYAYLLSWLYQAGFTMTGVLVLQMLVGSGTVLLTFLCGRLVFTPRIAFGGALILAVLPILPFFETQLLAETWTTALTMGSVLLVLRMVTGKTAAPGRTLFIAGALMGVAALGRPNLMLLIAAVAVWLWWWRRSGNRPPGGEVTTGSIILLLAGFLLAVSPATIHNLKYGEFSLISANLGANLVTGNSDVADGVSALPVGVVWDDFQLQTRQEGMTSPGQASRYLTGKALAWVAANPGRALGLLGKKALLLVNAQEGRNNINPAWFAREEGVFLLARWWPATWLILPVAILGMALFRRWPPGASLLLWMVLIQAAGVLPFFVNARFRMPLLPFLALFAAAGVMVLIEHWQAGDRRALAVRLGFVAALFVVVNVDWFDLGADRWLARDWFNHGLIQGRPYEGRQPNPALAEQSFRRAMALNGDEVDFPERLGATLLGKAQQRLKVGKEGVQRQDWATARGAFGQAEPLLQEARGLHRRAVDLYPRSFRSWINLGISSNWLGDVQAGRTRIAMAYNDTTAARTAAMAALQYYLESVGDYQKSLDVDPTLEDPKRNINKVFDSVMALPGLDPSITDFQRRAAAGVGNGSQGRR
ncbi:MAG: glycosyltransferase family 39 protein [Candidatus Krumholzibacteriota bacterium]